jgi:hypothetical protein
LSFKIKQGQQKHETLNNNFRIFPFQIKQGQQKHETLHKNFRILFHFKSSKGSRNMKPYTRILEFFSISNQARAAET